MARTKDPELNEQRKAEILRCAARVFKEKGFHAARTEEICASAGVSPGTLFRHFPDKRAIILAIAEIEFAEYMDEINRLASMEGLRWLTAIDGDDLQGLIQSSTYNLSADSWLELARDAERGQRLLAFDSELRSNLARRLAQGQAEGWVRPSIDAVGAANIILAIFTGLIVDQQQGIRIDTGATARALGNVLESILICPPCGSTNAF